MTNDELLTIARAIIIRCAAEGKECPEVERAVNTINNAHCKAQDIDFAFNVLAAEIQDFERWEKKK